MNTFKLLLSSITVLGITTAPLNAADRYWDINGDTPGAGGATPSGIWDAATANWTLDSSGSSATTTWLTTDRAVFSAGSDAIGPFTLTIDGTQAAAGMLVEEGAVTLAGGAVSIGSGNITLNPGTVLSINSTLRITATAGASMTLNGSTFRQTNPSNAGTFLNANIGIAVGAGGGTIDYTSSDIGTVALYSGTITGPGNTLTKTGAHEVRYQGAGLPNTTYSKLVVNQGLFRLGFSASTTSELGFGAAPVSFTADAITLTDGGRIGVSFGATLHENRGITLGAGGGGFFMSAAPLTVPGAISGIGGLTVTGGSQLTTLNGVNTFTGGFTMNGGGNVIVGASGRLSGAGPVTITSGTLTLNNDATTITSLTGAGNLAMANNHALTVGDNTSTAFTGVISGSGSLSKVGSGTLTLGGTGANTYAGGTTISDGTLLAGKNEAFGTGGMTLDGGALAAGGFSHTLGTLALGGNSIFDFGGGDSALTFADSSALDWGSFTLTIENWTSGSDTLRFGTEGTGLTGTQLNQIFFADLGMGALIDDAGFITPVPEPSTLALGLLGGLGLMFFIRRRRNA